MYGRSVFFPLAFCSLILIGGCQNPEAGDGSASDRVAGAAAEEGKCQIADTVLDAMSADALFQQPYVDMDEWRDEPVRHRYVHGGFEGTETRFSLYMPPEDQYDGRFFQLITPVPMNEFLLQHGATGEEDYVTFSIESGAYIIETNGGGMKAMMEDSTIGAYRANAAVAQYSRVIAMEMYGCERPYGYATGGSGGGYRTIGGMENTEGVWDGAVPFVIGSPMAMPYVFTVRMYALRVLKDKLPAIADAVDVGSNVDVAELLTDEEYAAFREVTAMGFPKEAWYVHDKLDLHGYASLFPGVVAADPTYFEDFWTLPGYEGYEPPQSLLDAMVEHPTVIKNLVFATNAEESGLRRSMLGEESRGRADDAWKSMIQSSSPDVPVAIQLADMPGKDLLGADLIIKSGEAAGSRLLITRYGDDFILVGSQDPSILTRLRAGDEVVVNNRNILASQTYHRHQVPEEGYPVYDQYRDETGEPIYPQRSFLLGPLMTSGAAGSVPSGKFTGKMIVLSNLHDTEAYPWQGDWYLQAAKSHLGDDLDDRLRLWYTDRSPHGDASELGEPTQMVSYLGVLQQALRDVSAWVEKGIEPPASSRYDIVGGQVKPHATAEERAGIQPVIDLRVDGQKEGANPHRAEVGVGEPVELVARVEVPPGAGKVVQAAWDFDGKGEFPERVIFDDDASESVTLRASHSYEAPGTYFVTLQVASQRDGDASTPFTLIRNLSRVRVVVE